MRYLFGVLVALVIGWGLWAPADTTELFPLQAVPSGGGSGCLPGSLCPPGNWVADLDEHFTGDSLDPNVWLAFSNGANEGAGISDCQTPGALVMDHPGVTIYGLPWDDALGLNHGCLIQTPAANPGGYSTPGFFEFNLTLDSQTNFAWTGGFFEFGNVIGCPYGPTGTVAQNGAEMDLAETVLATIGIHWNYGCESDQFVGTSHAVNGETHTWGVDYGDNAKAMFYVDGVQVGEWAPPDGVEPPGGCQPGFDRCSNGNWEGQFLFMDYECFYANPCGTTSNGTTIHWVRHYHH